MNKEKMMIAEGIKILMLLAILLTGAALSITACTPQQIVTGPGAGGSSVIATPTQGSGLTQSSATPNPIAGSIAFTSFIENGNSEISFVNTTGSNIASGTVIYFTNFNWDLTLNSNVGGFVDTSFQNAAGAGTTVSEGVISYTLTSALPPYTPVVIAKAGDTSSTYGTVANPGLGTVSGISNNSNNYLVLNHNGDGGVLFAYEASSPVAPGASTASVTFIDALIFGPNTWNEPNGNPVQANDCWDSYLPWAPAYSYSSSTGTTVAPTGAFPHFCAIDLSPLFVAMGGQNNSVQNQNALLASCESTLNTIYTGSNWQGNAAAKTGVEVGSTYTSVTACTGGTVGYTPNSGTTVTWTSY
jgi:hypothetical protein